MLVRFILGLFRRLVKPRGPLLSARAFEPCAHPLRPVLDERYLAMRAAMASGEAAAIAALLAPGYASVDIRGRKTDADHMIHGALTLRIDRSKRSVTTTLADICMNDERAIVLQHYLMRSEPDAPANMPRMLQALSIDVWRNAGGTWLLELTQTREMEVLNRNGFRIHLIARKPPEVELIP